MFATALAAYSLRTLLYTRLTPRTATWFLACECLHGVTFSLMRLSAVDYVRTALPPAWLTTGQLVLVTLGPQGAAGGLGALLGGMYMQRRGGRATYRIAALGSAALLGFHVLVSALLVLCKKPPLLGAGAAEALPNDETLGEAQEGGVTPLQGERGGAAAGACGWAGGQRPECAVGEAAWEHAAPPAEGTRARWRTRAVN